MPKDELPNHNCIKHLRSVVQQQQTRIAELEKSSAEHKHQLAEQVGPREHRTGPVPMQRGAENSCGTACVCACVRAHAPGCVDTLPVAW